MPIRLSSPTADVVAISDVMPIPGLGFLPVNAYLLRSAEPLLLDCGLPSSRAEFLQALWSVIEPTDLRWVYLTHPDRDHTGSLVDILEAAPAAKLITTFLGVGILSIEHQISLDRILLLNPGQSLDLGDRRLAIFRPPLYDSPATTGCFDHVSGACFTSDCFGSPVTSEDQAAADDIAELSVDDLSSGQRLWATVDSPWVSVVDRKTFYASLDPLRRLDPSVVLCSHLPPARAATSRLLNTLETAVDADPYVGPDQAALQRLLAEMEPSG